MQRWVVICWASLALVAAYECPGGGRCADGQTCCSGPVNGYECCPFDQAECCEDHVHCCPAGTICDMSTSSCVNANGSIPWMERTPANQPRLSRSFRMIKTYMREEDDNICPDQSRCPPEFSCLMALTKYGCCPLAQGISCSDGKHCCPEGHECSADSRSCVKKEVVTTVLCSDGVSECPDGTTCCENTEGKWGCCPMPKAVCCEDKIHCCPEGSTCDVEHSKCISSTTRKETPMWAKLPARIRAEWENQKECKEVTAKTVENDSPEKVPEVTTENPVPFSDKEVSVSSFSAAIAGDVPCNDTAACPDGTTCCKTQEGGWACCPLPQAVCCEDHIHCCPHGKKCNVAAGTCDDGTCSVPWFLKLPTIPRKNVRSGGVICDSTHKCPDNTTCCKNNQGGWSCCPLPQAVCCDDHEHCCPSGYTCDTAALTCVGSSDTTPMQRKTPALTTDSTTEDTLTATSTDTQSSEASTEQTEDKTEETEEPEENKEVDDRIKCDDRTSCPRSTTCCFMQSSQKWGCCPLPEAVCCSDGNHCCPANYRCNEINTSCVKGDVVIPWYTKLPADTSDQAVPSSVQCDDQSQCPEHTTCCQLATGQWGCCPLEHAVCCPDKEHCCPQGYTCNMAANSCQKPISLLLDTIPLTPVYPPLSEPEQKDVKCDETASCPDGTTCCKMSATQWGCCPIPNAVCCSDMVHCCPAGYTCDGSGQCTQNPAHWYSWNVFLGNKKRALIL